MTGHAKVKYNNTSSGGFTQNTEYDVLGWAVDGGNVLAIVVDDNGAPAHIDTNNGSGTLVAAFLVERVV